MILGVVDVLRIASGILVFNALASYWCTGSSTWGYTGKYTSPRFYMHLATPYVNLSLSQLALYNGTDSPIFVAVNGSVYDVTMSSHIYGPTGPYKFFSGKDCARAFVTGCFNNPEELTYDLRGLDPQEVALQLLQWQKFFNDKYWYVGTVRHDPIAGDIPPQCDHVRFPG